jgi:hypothetical protein
LERKEEKSEKLFFVFLTEFPGIFPLFTGGLSCSEDRFTWFMLLWY